MNTDMSLGQPYVCALRQLPQFLRSSLANYGRFSGKHHRLELLVVPDPEDHVTGMLHIEDHDGAQSKVDEEVFLRRPIWAAVKIHLDQSDHPSRDFIGEVRHITMELNERYGLDLKHDY